MLHINLKGIKKCSNMVANIFKIQLFHNMAIMHINLKGITNAANIYHRGMGSKVQNSTFQNMVMLHIKLNGISKCSNMVANILPADPPPP